MVILASMLKSNSIEAIRASPPRAEPGLKREERDSGNVPKTGMLEIAATSSTYIQRAEWHVASKCDSFITGCTKLSAG